MEKKNYGKKSLCLSYNKSAIEIFLKKAKIAEVYKKNISIYSTQKCKYSNVKNY